MVSQTTFNPAMGNYNYQYPLASNNTNLQYGITGNIIPNDYTDDIMMSTLDFSNPETLKPIGQQVPATSAQTAMPSTQTPAFTSNPQQSVQQAPATNELDGYLVKNDPNLAYTENGNAYKKSNTGKILGAIGGFFAPLTGKIAELFKGGNIKNLFKFKQLAIVCPALALAGLGIGALIDGFSNSKKAQAADALANQSQQTQIQQTALDTKA